MNADEIAKTLRQLAKNCDGSHKCFHANLLRSAADEINHLKAEIRGRADMIERLQTEIAEMRKDCDITDAANIALHGALEASQRRERAATELLRTIDWVGSGAKGRIEDAIAILSGDVTGEGDTHD